MIALVNDDTAALQRQGTTTARLDGSSLESAKAVPPSPRVNGGTRIGRYEVRNLLGRGGMGSVYRAFDPVLEREVALKVMLAEIVHDPEQKQRFEREARAVARLSHAGVVKVFDLGYHTDGSPYIVMELLRGRDLLARMQADPPLSLPETISIVTQLLDGLGHAHGAGIVHRDIKPANIFLTEEGARIMDFGLAYFTSSGATSQSIMGTVAYMSAEQVLGERLDGRSDLFSVGTLLCELLTGRRPFAADTPAATLYRIAHDEPQIDVPAGSQNQRFLPVLRRAMARKVAERYQNAAEFADALRTCTAEPQPAASRPSPVPASSVGGRQADPSDLFQLLRTIYVEEKTGQLHFAAGLQRKSIGILKGRILNGSSDVAGEHLGDVLVRFGLLGQSDLERAVSVVLGERKRLGVVLSEMGLLDRGTLEEAAGIHVREILFDALDRTDVSVSFEELAESNLEADLVSPQSMGQVILEATHRILNPDLVRRVLGDTRRVLALSADPLLRSQMITLTPTDGFVLSRVDGTLSARDVMSLIPLPAEDTERSLFSLLCTGIIGYRTGSEARQPPIGEPTAHSARRPVLPPQRPSEPAPAQPAVRTPTAPSARAPETPQAVPQAAAPSPRTAPADLPRIDRTRSSGQPSGTSRRSSTGMPSSCSSRSSRRPKERRECRPGCSSRWPISRTPGGRSGPRRWSSSCCASPLATPPRTSCSATSTARAAWLPVRAPPTRRCWPSSRTTAPQQAVRRSFGRSPSRSCTTGRVREILRRR